MSARMKSIKVSLTNHPTYLSLSEATAQGDIVCLLPNANCLHKCEPTRQIRPWRYALRNNKWFRVVFGDLILTWHKVWSLSGHILISWRQHTPTQHCSCNINGEHNGAHVYLDELIACQQSIYRCWLNIIQYLDVVFPLRQLLLLLLCAYPSSGNSFLSSPEFSSMYSP